MSWCRWLLMISWMAVALGNQHAWAVVFSDGQTHVVEQPSGSVSVLNSAPPDSAPTKAIIAAGGTIELFTSGAIGANAFDSSSIELAGGNITTHGMQGHGAAAFHQARLKFVSGTISALGQGGTGVLLQDDAQVEIFGGTITAPNAFGVGLEISHQSIATIFGGTIRATRGTLSLGGTSQLHVYGGTLGDMDGGTDLSTGGGEAHFYGSQFFLNGQPVGSGLLATPPGFEGRLTGLLQSGEALDIGIRVLNIGGPFTASVYLHSIPEPSALTIGSVPMLWVAVRWRRRRVQEKGAGDRSGPHDPAR